MNPRERIMATLMGEEPDKIPVVAADYLRKTSQGGWLRRLEKRGLGVIRLISPYKPAFVHPHSMNPNVEGVVFHSRYYMEKGVPKCRNTFETPVGEITELLRFNQMDFGACATEENFIKEPRDWAVINFIFGEIIKNLRPNFDEYNMVDDELGDRGLAYATVEKTPFQRSFVELATPERTFVDFAEEPDEFLEFLELQLILHRKIAEIVRECPAPYIDVMDHITDIISPRYYKKFCLPIYQIYKDALKGTGKKLGAHMDGRFGHLKKEIAEAPLDVMESFTVPPVGDVSLTEARELWPDKTLFINCPPHLNWAEPDEARSGYEAIAEEWNSKKGLLIEHSEEIPLERIEGNLSAALDVFGY